MPENKPVIGLTWEPKIPFLSSSSSTSTSTTSTDKTLQSKAAESSASALCQPASKLIDGLYLPPNDPKKLKKLLRKEIKDTTGKDWFEMPAATITPELKKDLQLLKLRNALDPKRHYKKGESKSKTLPKYFQVGTLVESPLDFFTGRLTKKERKTTLAQELLSDTSLAAYRKRKVHEIEEQNRPGGNEKWKIKGKQTRKRAKDRRH